MTDTAWPFKARAETNDLTERETASNAIDFGYPATAITAQANEAIVNTLVFDPFLHFQFQCDPPLNVEINSSSRAPLYIVGTNGCQLRWESNAPLILHAGDVVFLPHAGRHRIYTDERAPLQHFRDLMSQGLRRRGNSFDIVVGQATNASRSAENRWSGSFYWRSDLSAHPLTASLPPVLKLAKADAMAWLPTMTQLVAWMADINGGGNGVGLKHVMNSLMQQLVLVWLGDPGRVAPGARRDFSAPRDDRLLAALQSIHTQSGHPWTASSLAALCHMTRTQFTQRFQAQTGLPPMRYLTRWRLHLADRMLKEQRLTLQQVADAVGYSTGAILARAYKRERGAAPKSVTHDEQPAEKSR
jgi:AraC-like DNA-binding protein